MEHAASSGHDSSGLGTGLAIVVDILVDGRPIESLECLLCGLVSFHVTCKGDCVCKV